MYLNPILILYHFKPLMALTLQKYTLDQSTWQTGKRGTAKTFDGTWGFCLAHPAEQRWGTQKIPGSQAGSPGPRGQEGNPWPTSLGSGMVIGSMNPGTCPLLEEMGWRWVHGAVNESLCLAVGCLEGCDPPWCWYPLSWHRQSARDPCHGHFRVI